jgi:hypothetical protein
MAFAKEQTRADELVEQGALPIRMAAQRQQEDRTRKE